jgi:hypothetical protein
MFLLMIGMIAAGIAVVVGAVSLYLLFGWFLIRHREVCPRCGRRALRLIQWIRATVLIEGQRRPDSWGYFLCDACGAKWKQHRGREFEIPAATEWDRCCSRLRRAEIRTSAEACSQPSDAAS